MVVCSCRQACRQRLGSGLNVWLEPRMVRLSGRLENLALFEEAGHLKLYASWIYSMLSWWYKQCYVIKAEVTLTLWSNEHKKFMQVWDENVVYRSVRYHIVFYCSLVR